MSSYVSQQITNTGKTIHTYIKQNIIKTYISTLICTTLNNKSRETEIWISFGSPESFPLRSGVGAVEAENSLY